MPAWLVIEPGDGFGGAGNGLEAVGGVDVVEVAVQHAVPVEEDAGGTGDPGRMGG